MKQFEEMMSLVVKPEGNAPVYNCMLSVKSESSGLCFWAAKGTTGKTGAPVSVHHSFRCGSITKMFTAAVILQLAEEGLLRVDDAYLSLVNSNTRNMLSGLHMLAGNDLSGKITVLHLLRHSSGLRDHFSNDGRFIDCVMQNPSRSWNWELVMEKYFAFGLNNEPMFCPGNGYHYSDTNYLLLAVLIEQLTGKPLHEAYRERIITPLALHDTYLEFYEQQPGMNPVVYPYYGINALEQVNTSFDWGCGGLISTMNDLDIFIRALVRGKLFKHPRSLELMMQFNSEPVKNSSIKYGAGMQGRYLPGYSFAGHSSAYGSMLFYEPGKDTSVVLSLNQAHAAPKAEWMMKKIAGKLV